MGGVMTHRLGAFSSVVTASPTSGVLAYASGASTASPILFDNEAYDVDGWHDNSTNTERLVVPGGVSFARAIACINRGSGTLEIDCLKSGSSFAGAFVNARSDTGGADTVSAASAIVAVSASQYFSFTHSAGITIEANSWGAAEAIPSTRKTALVQKSANQAVAAATFTNVTFDSEVRDTDSWHDAIASTVTITIASPGVITWTGHNFVAGAPIVLTTTGALPTGLTAGTTYYVVSPAANTFRLATAPGGTAINTTGSQSGTHTGTNTSRLVVPSGVSLIRLSAFITGQHITAGDQLVLLTQKNGGSAVGMAQNDQQDGTAIGGVSAILAVSAGDYFECQFHNTSASNILTANATWFQIEEIDSATKYALVNKSGTQALSAGVSTACAFGAETADTSAFHDNSTNNSRLTIPSGQGITQARLSFNLHSALANGQLIAEVRKNGTAGLGVGLPKAETDTLGTDNLNGFGAWIDVVAGDYFELFVNSTNAQTLPVDDTTWFCIETR